jgi:hypothetical protein
MPRVLESLDLFAPETAPASRADRRPAPRKSQLWVAVSLPKLALECLPAVLADPAIGNGSRVVVEAERGQLHVVAANAAATEAGIARGTKLSTALALAASLQVFERAAHRELASLESLASFVQTLTSTVSIEAPDSVLLEVAGSLRLKRWCGR